MSKGGRRNVTPKELRKRLVKLLKRADWRQLRLVYSFATALMGDTATQEDTE